MKTSLRRWFTTCAALLLTSAITYAQPQPGDTGPRMVDYVKDIQPILDRCCISCHGGQNPKAHLDLTGELTDNWTHSYESICGKGLVAVFRQGMAHSP